uniref:Uncharacterized protein n=1 Tax=Solanum lycopersicum TaxID=4081 RepID=K4BZ71_SOLLC
MVEKISIEDVMKVLIASRKQDMPQVLWTTCSHLVAKSGLPPEIVAKHLPIDVVAKIEEICLKTSLVRKSLISHHHQYHHQHDLISLGGCESVTRARCSQREPPGWSSWQTPLHIASEMLFPDMVVVLLDHHADPNDKTMDGITPLDILRALNSDLLFKGVIPCLTHIEPNKLRLCLELVQSAAMVISREEENTNNDPSSTAISQPINNEDHGSSTSNTTNVGGNNLNLDSRMVYLNLGSSTLIAQQIGCNRMTNDDIMIIVTINKIHGGFDPSSMHHPYL